MKNLCRPGDVRVHRKKVEERDVAAFETGTVHRVCSTFALAREIEWASRLFVLDMLEADEEGIGTLLEISHRAPALVGEELEIEATVESLSGHELICRIEVRAGGRLVATGRTGQKVLKKDKLAAIFRKLQNHG